MLFISVLGPQSANILPGRSMAYSGRTDHLSAPLIIGLASSSCDAVNVNQAGMEKAASVVYCFGARIIRGVRRETACLRAMAPK